MTGTKNAYNTRLTIALDNQGKVKTMTTGKALNGKPHVRFDEGEAAPAATPRRGSLLYSKRSVAALLTGLVNCMVASAAGRPMFDYRTSDEYGQSCFTRISEWMADGVSATELPNPSADYRILNNARTPEPTAAVQDFSFAGNSLHVGLVNGQPGSLLVKCAYRDTAVRFENEGLYFHSGYLASWDARNARVYGAIHVDAIEQDPFRVFMSGGDAGVMDFHGPFSGAGFLWLHSRIDFGTQAQTDFHCRFHDDALKDFTGTIDSYFAMPKFLGPKSPDGYSQTFVTDSGSFPGHLRLNPGSKYEPMHADVNFSVRQLTLGDDTVVKALVAADGLSASRLSVTETLTQSVSSALAVRGGVSWAAIKSATATPGSVYEIPGLKAPVFSVPVGMSLTRSFCGERDISPCLYKASVETEDGYDVVYVTPEAKRVVQHIATAVDGYGQNSFSGTGAESPSSWSDGNAPTDSETIYMMFNKTIRTMEDYGEGRMDKFLGKALVVTNTSPYIQLNIYCGGIEVPDLRVFDRYIINNIAAKGASAPFTALPDGCTQSVFPVKGRIGVSNGGGARSLEFRCYSSKIFDIQAELYGHGGIVIQTTSQSGAPVADGGARLTGTNVNYAGTLTVNTQPSFSGRYTHLYVSDSRNLGGPCPTWTYNALYMGIRSVFHPLQSLTLDEPTRGICCTNDEVRFDIPSGVVFTCKQRFTRMGTVVKSGAGVFALGGERPYYGEPGNATPTAESNRFVVREGALKPVSDEAFQGLQVEMSEETEIVLDMPTDRTGGVGKYGMRNTAWDCPLVLPEQGVAVRILDPEGRTSLDAVPKPRIVPVCTVKASAAPALRGRFRVVSHPYRDCSTSVAEIDNGDETVTFAVRFSRGTLLILR